MILTPPKKTKPSRDVFEIILELAFDKNAKQKKPFERRFER